MADDRLVVESKGIYSIENFLTARRLMYWQVYLHKTSVAYEKMLISTLLRAKELASQGIELFASPALHFFLYNDITPTEFYSNPDCLENFIQLDDNDIWTALKVWSTHTDKVLSTLSMGMINFANQPTTRHTPFRSELFCFYPQHRKEYVRPGR